MNQSIEKEFNETFPAEDFMIKELDTFVEEYMVHAPKERLIAFMDYAISVALNDIKELLLKEMPMHEPNLSVSREQGSEFTTPRMYRAYGYDRCLTDCELVIEKVFKSLDESDTDQVFASIDGGEEFPVDTITRCTYKCLEE